MHIALMLAVHCVAFLTMVAVAYSKKSNTRSWRIVGKVNDIKDQEDDNYSGRIKRELLVEDLPIQADDVADTVEKDKEQSGQESKDTNDELTKMEGRGTGNQIADKRSTLRGKSKREGEVLPRGFPDPLHIIMQKLFGDKKKNVVNHNRHEGKNSLRIPRKRTAGNKGKSHQAKRFSMQQLADMLGIKELSTQENLKEDAVQKKRETLSKKFSRDSHQSKENILWYESNNEDETQADMTTKYAKRGNSAVNGIIGENNDKRESKASVKRDGSERIDFIRYIFEAMDTV